MQRKKSPATPRRTPKPKREQSQAGVKIQRRSFSKNIHKIAPSVPIADPKGDSYRGIRHNVFHSDAHEPVFRAEAILNGLPPFFPAFDPRETVITNEIFAKQKKLPVLKPLSSKKKIPEDKFTTDDEGPLLIVNPKKPENMILIDAVKAYELVFKIKFNDDDINENEFIVFALLYSSIQAFEFRGEINSNPFYLHIADTDKANLKLHQECYDDFCKMHHFGSMRKDHPEEDISLEYAKSKREYYTKLFTLYNRVYNKENPFNLSIAEFKERYKSYSKYFFHVNNSDYANKFSLFQKKGVAGKVTVLEFLTGSKDVEEIISKIDPINYNRIHEESKIIREDDALRKAFKMR
jgi:hypothetical protein